MINDRYGGGGGGGGSGGLMSPNGGGGGGGGIGSGIMSMTPGGGGGGSTMMGSSIAMSMPSSRDFVDLHELAKGWKAAIARAKDPATRCVRMLRVCCVLLRVVTLFCVLYCCF